MEELLEALEEMVRQHCTVFTTDLSSYLDSMALSANADAMRLLEKHNIIIIEKEYGRRIIAKWRTK
jgi:hypothetical protein